MSTVLIYTTATNWDYIYGAFANVGNSFSISESSEVVDLPEDQNIDTNLSEVVTPQLPDENFKKGLEKAMNAAVLVQTEKSKPEWEFVATQWQNAIDYMKQVQPDDSNYKAAQERVIQYQKNLEYARLVGSLAE
jgi:hypothetical protein